jgi:hypothetical protein
MTDIIKNEILRIETYPFVKDTIEVLAKGRGMTASEFAESLLEEALEELWEKSRNVI